MNLPPTKPTPPPPPSHAALVKGECGNCYSKDRRILHRLVIRGIDRRVCTTCVLRLHPSWFCPSCFELIQHPLPQTQRLIPCTKCPSYTHHHCLPSPPPSPFLCPPCSNPNNFSYFPNCSSPVDKRHALVLVCACKIATASIAKCLSQARHRADKALRDAAVARKRARDALDRCSALDRVKRLEEVSASRNLGLVNNNNNNNNNHKVVCKKEEFNGLIGGGQGKVMVPSNPVSKIGAINVNEGKLGNREQDLRNCNGSGRIVDVSTTTSTLNIS